MASLESLTIAQQATNLLSNVRRDIIDTATSLKARLDANEWTATYVRSQANAQGVQLVASLQRVANHQAAVEAALTDWSVDVGDTQAEYALLRNAAEALRDATVGNVTATLTQIIANVLSKTRLY